jgi:WD40 repeat protein
VLDMPRVAVDPRGDRGAVPANDGHVFVVPVAGATRRLEGFSARTDEVPVAFSPDGRFLAAAPRSGPADEKVVRVWDLESGATRVLGPLPGAGEGLVGGVKDLAFVDGVFQCPRCISVALGPTETIVAAGSEAGIVRIGPILGESRISSLAGSARSRAGRGWPSRPTAAGWRRVGNERASASGQCLTSPGHPRTGSATKRYWPRSIRGRPCAR